MQFANKTIDLTQPRVMGILNVTPDSFSDGGRFTNMDAALNHTKQMLDEGADFIDIGGESTRPGAADVTLEQELDRVIPVVETICREFDCVVSVDTSKAQVMTEAVKAGAGLINDIRALREPGALQAAKQADVAICLMHMQGKPRTMQHNPEYGDVVADVLSFLQERVLECEKVGISRDKIILDPGFGFGKNQQQNYQLLACLQQFDQMRLPLLVGMSRKSMLGNVINRDTKQRLAASIAAATVALMQGAQIIRVHDVAETVDAIKIIQAVKAI
ncbi:dihydropteroate synthase [Neptunicella sp. SCSIO 80796]|uniref:dihydropteroate synthase n=1 Tax=Neptunicella plasticusilytica TaxID=3117012 RepID=UPI003A4E0DA9